MPRTITLPLDAPRTLLVRGVDESPTGRSLLPQALDYAGGDLSGQLALAVTDNGQQKAFVLGAAVSQDALPELSGVRVRVRINGAEVATASGDAVLGHPYNSVVWLASKLAQFGERVSAGDYIMSGSFTRQFPIEPGDRVEVDFVGVGDVQMEMLG